MNYLIVKLREALANCLIHCNYAQQGNILVVGRRNEITMRNPGCMLISVAEFYAGSHSICRNPTLQKLFMFLGNGEKAGSGADIIKKGWRDNKWPQPVLSERVQPNESILTLSVGDVGENVTKDVTKELTDRQKTILEIIKENPLVTIPEMSLKTGVTTRTIKRDIEDLQSWGILFRKGGRKEGEWIIKTTD